MHILILGCVSRLCTPTSGKLFTVTWPTGIPNAHNYLIISNYSNFSTIHEFLHKKQGNINTAFELAIRDETFCFSIAIDVIERVPRLEVAGAHAKDKFKNEQIDCRGYAYENGIDSVTRKPANEFSRVETWKPEGSFLFGLIIGAGGMLLLPEFTTRPEKLEGQVRDLSDQVKKMTQQKPGDDQPKQASPSPSPHLGDLKGCVTKRFRRRSTILSRIG